MRAAIVGVFGAGATTIAGPARVSRALTAALLAQGVDADLYEVRTPRSWLARVARIDDKACAVPGLPPVRVLSPRAALSLADRGYTLVHLLGALGLYSLPLACALSRRRVPMVATLNGLFVIERAIGYPYSRLDVWAERAGLRLASRVVAVSDLFRGEVEERYPMLAGRVAAIPHGHDDAGQTDTGDAQGVGSRCGVLCLGGTERVKGIPFLLAAVERLRAAGVQAPVTVAGPRGTEHRVVTSDIDRLRPLVTYRGAIEPDAVGPMYRRCRVYVQPSRRETFGLAVLEAMAGGAPVVVTRTCGVAGLIEDGTSGFVVDYGDVGALADRLGRLLADPSLAAAMGRAASAVAREWTWARAAVRYKTLYQHLADSGDEQ